MHAFNLILKLFKNLIYTNAAIADHVPGVPAVVQTHPGVDAAEGTAFITTSPTFHVPTVGIAFDTVTNGLVSSLPLIDLKTDDPM
jgi:hypothetical protein